MNFDFSPEQQELRHQVRRFLEDRCPTSTVRAAMADGAVPDPAIWRGMAELGLLGITIGEAYGGLGLGYLELCVVAEEVGRAVAPVPLFSTVYLAAELIMAAGSEAQKQRWLPAIAAGEAVGTLALAERLGRVAPATIETIAADGLLSGRKLVVPDGGAADFAIVAARDEAGVSLHLVALDGTGITRAPTPTVDPSRDHATLTFASAPAEPLGAAGEGWPLLRRCFDRAAVLLAFEQVGGADAALAMARDYALERMAFGRQIGSFQALKHMMADMYVAATLARSNAYYGAWALATGAAELPQAAAIARVSATDAYQRCAADNIQVHGGIGFTWEADPHLHYRRSNLLAVALGGKGEWEDRLIDRLDRTAKEFEA